MAGNNTLTYKGACLIRPKAGEAPNTSLVTMPPPDTDFNTFWYFVLDQKVDFKYNQWDKMLSYLGGGW